MHIHTKKENESINDIALSHGVPLELIKTSNELSTDAAVGEELLILTPTRSYKVRYGDTAERIALRFGIGVGDIYLNNPTLMGKDPAVGDTIVIKRGERSLGMSVANGYFYKGCDLEKLKRALPFLTYVSFGSAISQKNQIRRIMDDSRYVKLVKDMRKIPLVRVFDSYKDRYRLKDNLEDYAEELIAFATEGGYKGIVLNACQNNNSAENFSSFLIKLRKLMIGCDLILITEINEDSPTEFSEYADGSVLYYPKYSMENPHSFDDGERAVLEKLATSCESAKIFVDLPSLARCGKDFVNINSALENARRGKCEILQNKSTLLSHFSDKKQGEYVFPSLSSIEEILKLVGELDYMGICFDIMRTPLNHLMMYSALFKNAYHTSVRTREGCSHANEE